MKKLLEKFCKESIIIVAVALLLAIIVIIIGAVVPTKQTKENDDYLVDPQDVFMLTYGDNYRFNKTEMFSFTPSSSATYNITITQNVSYYNYYNAYYMIKNSKTDFENKNYTYLSQNSNYTVSVSRYLNAEKTYYFYVVVDDIDSSQYLTITINN